MNNETRKVGECDFCHIRAIVDKTKKGRWLCETCYYVYLEYNGWFLK
jgi:ribosomal protein L37AE/L43A